MDQAESVVLSNPLTESLSNGHDSLINGGCESANENETEAAMEVETAEVDSESSGKKIGDGDSKNNGTSNGITSSRVNEVSGVGLDSNDTEDNSGTTKEMEEVVENGNNEEEKEEDPEPEVAAVPTKIALKVPSLFLSSSKPTSSTPESASKELKNDSSKLNGSNKPHRPMPASKRKKLEASNKTESGDEFPSEQEMPRPSPKEDDASSNTSETKSIPPKKPSRPMPASARKKLEGSSTSQSVAPAEASESVSLPVTTDEEPAKKEEKKTSKPMPASAKRKSEKQEGQDEAAPTTEAKPSRPMPASARKKLEKSEKVVEDQESDNLLDNIALANRNAGCEIDKEKEPESDEKLASESEKASGALNLVPETSEKSDIVKKKKPMPASAKKKLETKNESNREEAKESNNTDSESTRNEMSETSLSTTSKRPMPASVRQKLAKENVEDGSSDAEKAEDEPDSNQIPEEKKINISLGGIKFPTFKKPMPASVRNKLENKEQENQKGEESEIDANPNDTETTTARSLRRVRSSVLGNELQALLDEKFICDICQAEFYSKSKWQNHRDAHFKRPAEKLESHPKPKAPSEKKKTPAKKEYKYEGSCPICYRSISNRKKLNKHVSSCRSKHQTRCKICDKQCKTKANFEEHMKTHSGNPTESVKGSKVNNEDSINDGSPPPSPVSNTSEKSSNASSVSNDNGKKIGVVAKSDAHSSTPSTSNLSENRSSNVESFKKKIASVLTNLGNWTQKTKRQHKEAEEEGGDEEDDAEPPKKKVIMSSSESTKRLAMPASMRKKLEEKSSQPKELHDLECEVCHKVFTQMSNRQRHERTVHSIANPRTGSTGETKSKSTTLPTTSKETLPKNPNNTSTTTSSAKHWTLESLPNAGTCPICSRYFANRLRRHCKNVHQVKAAATTINSIVSGSDSNLTRKISPKSYKIYKTAASMIKKKLSATSNVTSSSRFSRRRQESPVRSEASEDEEMPEPTPVPVRFEKPSERSSKAESKKPESQIKSKSASQIPPSSSSSGMPTIFKCGCCDKTFKVQADLNEHMSKRVPKQKRLFTCTLCNHMFSHEDDFILHVQFVHKELVSGMKHVQQSATAKPQASFKSTSKPQAEGSSTDNSKHSSAATSLLSSSRRSLRNPSSNANDHDYKAAITASLPKCSINISDKEKATANLALEAENVTNADSRSSKRNASGRFAKAKIRSPSPPVLEPEEIMDTFDDHHDDGNVDDQMDIEQSDLAITSTFSQRISPRTGGSASNEKNNEESTKMPCSTCSEVFYSYESLRKHELYYHNIKNTQMCSICGVYPTRLSRHLLAHENKTVRCSCAPCGTSFSDFSLLLKHNLKHHPGPDGGALTAANKSKSKPGPASVKNKLNKEKEETDELPHKCLICHRECSNFSAAKMHVRRAHPEREDVESFIKKVGREEEKDNDKDASSEEMDKILEDTNEKLQDPDWNDNDSDFVPTSPAAVSRSPSPPPPPPSPKPITTNRKPGPARAMPASARAKLAATQSSQNEVDKKKIETETAQRASSGLPKRAMPASIKAKLEAKKKMDEESQKKSSVSGKSTPTLVTTAPAKPRPMPASARLKLEKQKETVSVPSKPTSTLSDSISIRSFDSLKSATASKAGSSVSSRPRAMPASVKKRILNKAELKEMVPTPPPATRIQNLPSPPPSPEPIDLCDDEDVLGRSTGGDVVFVEGASGSKKAVPSSEVVTLDDDDDEIAVVSESTTRRKGPGSSFSFNIADEIAEHNRAVQMAMGSGSGQAQSTQEYNMVAVFNCKLCSTKFDELEGVRGHIHEKHCEYGDEHTENLYEKVFEKRNVVSVSTPANRRRRSNTNYHKSYNVEEDEVEDEIIVSRGTSTRPRTAAGTEDSSYHGSDAPSTPPSISHSVENVESLTEKPLLYACKFCGQRKDTQGKIKQHIVKAHPTFKGRYQDDVVTLEPGKEHEFVPMLPQTPVPTLVQDNPQVESQVSMITHSVVSSTPSLPVPITFKCKICQKTLERKASLAIHIHRAHPEFKQSGQKVADFIQDVYENELLNSAMADNDVNNHGSATYSCGFCVFQTEDEDSYVQHYKTHTGVSPYQCQFCAAQFNTNQEVTNHKEREHTGAEFMNNDESEISMEEMVGIGEISVSTSTRIQIEQPQMISLGRHFGGNESTVSESPSPVKRGKPGPASKKAKAKKEVLQTSFINENDEMEDESEPVSTNGNLEDVPNNDFEMEDEQPMSLPFQGDLSSLFSTLGGSAGAPGSLDDIDGGMDLD